jgi:hypothetical protein
MADNTLAIRHWLTQLKLTESLTISDIDRLSQLKMSTAIQRLLYNLLEHCDANQSPKQCSETRTQGLSIHFETKCSLGTRSPGSSGIRMWTSLHKAVMYGNADAVRHFIDQGVDIHERDSDGWTPLHVRVAFASASFSLKKRLTYGAIVYDDGSTAHRSVPQPTWRLRTFCSTMAQTLMPLLSTAGHRCIL